MEDRILFVDCGGHDGSSVREARRRWPGCQVVTFEPAPKFAGSYGCFPDHELVRAAAWDTDGVAPFFLGECDLSSSLLREKTSGGLDLDHPVIARTVDLARWFRDSVPPGFRCILKLDVEGAEYRILQRMLDASVLHWASELYIEWHWDRIGMSREAHEEFSRRVGEVVPIHPWQADGG